MMGWRVGWMFLVMSASAMGGEATKLPAPHAPEAIKARPPWFLPQIKTNGLVPATHRYLVVVPRPSLPPPPSICIKPDRWIAESVTASPYPYGWFGAGSHEQASRRGSYYGDTRDYMRLRSN